jgi:hypothetical protein
LRTALAAHDGGDRHGGRDVRIVSLVRVHSSNEPAGHVLVLRRQLRWAHRRLFQRRLLRLAARTTRSRPSTCRLNPGRTGSRHCRAAPSGRARAPARE